MADKFPHQAEYHNLWSTMDIDNDKVSKFQEAALTILNHKQIYKELEEKTGVPFDLIGVIHFRESNCDLSTHLHNGDSLRRRTVNEPKGRPLAGKPPYGFVESALDALHYDGLDTIKDWSIERRAYFLERYNGFGYRNKGINSPYLWAGTDRYTKGKYIKDGVFNPNVVDAQLGAMGILKTLYDLNGTEIPKAVAEKTILESTTGKAIEDTSDSYMTNNSRKFYLLQRMKQMIVGFFVTIFTYVESLDFETAKTYAAQVREAFANYGPYALILILGAAYLILHKVQSYTKEDVKNGTYTPSGSLK